MAGAIGDAAQYAAMCFILNGLTGRAAEGQGAAGAPFPLARAGRTGGRRRVRCGCGTETVTGGSLGVERRVTFCIGLAREKGKNEETREIGQNGIVCFSPAARGRGHCANSRSFPHAAPIPKNLKPYFLCLPEKGERWTPVQFVDSAMQEHMAYIREQVEAGKYVVVGPVADEGRI